MSSCPNCGSKITCGCQKRTLPDGTQGCSSCSGKVKGSINKAPVPVGKRNRNMVTPEGKSPTQLNVWGKDRYVQLQKFTK